jgi:hypothetical protein
MAVTDNWTFGDAERAYKKYIDIADEYNWTIEEINGEDWIELTNACDAIIKLRKLLGRIYRWDHMDTAADITYWRSEIAALLGRSLVSD